MHNELKPVAQSEVKPLGANAANAATSIRASQRKPVDLEDDDDITSIQMVKTPAPTVTLEKPKQLLNAVSRGSLQEVMKLVEEQGVDVMGRCQLVLNYCRAMADNTPLTFDGVTLLHVAAENGSAEILQYLLPRYAHAHTQPRAEHFAQHLQNAYCCNITL